MILIISIFEKGREVTAGGGWGSEFEWKLLSASFLLFEYFRNIIFRAKLKWCGNCGHYLGVPVNFSSFHSMLPTVIDLSSKLWRPYLHGS